MSRVRSLRVDINGSTAGLRDATVEARRLLISVGSSAASMGKSIAGALFNVKSLIASGGVLAGLGFGVKLAADAEQLAIAFEVMLGSGAAARKLISDLTKFSDVTPFEPGPVIEAGRSLLAFNFSAEQIIPTLTRLGDVASGVGMPLGELAEIYGKARVQNRLFMDDISQLTGRGIPVITELAKVFGVAESKVRDLVEKGKVGFPELEKVFINLTSEGGRFAGLMDKQSKSLNGLLSTLKGEFLGSLREVGAALIEEFDLKGVVGNITAFLRSNREQVVGFMRDLFQSAREALPSVAQMIQTIMKTFLQLGVILVQVAGHVASVGSAFGLIDEDVADGLGSTQADLRMMIKDFEKFNLGDQVRKWSNSIEEMNLSGKIGRQLEDAKESLKTFFEPLKTEGVAIANVLKEQFNNIFKMDEGILKGIKDGIADLASTDLIGNFETKIKNILEAAKKGLVNRDDAGKLIGSLQEDLLRDTGVQSMLDDLKSPLDKIQEKVQEVRSAFSKGLIDEGQMNALLDRLQTEANDATNSENQYRPLNRVLLKGTAEAIMAERKNGVDNKPLVDVRKFTEITAKNSEKQTSLLEKLLDGGGIELNIAPGI